MCTTDEMSDSSENKEVKTRIPPEQVEIWTEEADEMNVPRSEYIRYMVQAGRRQFAFTEAAASDTDGTDINRRVVAALQEHNKLSWEELTNEVIGDLEDEIEDAVEELEDVGDVRTSLRNDSITLK
jgi:hypothetical protein